MTGFDLLIGLREDWVPREPAPPLNYRALWPGETPTRRIDVCGLAACGKEYRPNSGRQAYCSQACAGLARRVDVELKARRNRDARRAKYQAAKARAAVADILAARWAK